VQAFYGHERRGSSHADVHTFRLKKTPDFSKFMVCPHEQGGLSQCGHFAAKGERRVIFHDFVRTPFVDGPLPLH